MKYKSIIEQHNYTIIIFSKTYIRSMNYNKVSDPIVKQLQEICGDAFVFVDTDVRKDYSHDYTEDLSFMPEVVVKPANAAEISAIVKLCNAQLIPVTPRAAGTGLSGGALPVFGGIILSCERLNKIIEIDQRNLQATVEPGVINQVLRDAVEAVGLFYPPDPASRGSSMLGGNLAECAGGPKAVKYGVTKDYVLNIEVVLPTGEIIWTGANVLKNSTGYNLTQLMVGSEGTLGIVTKIVFKLIPLPKHDLLLLVPFASPEKACEAVSAVFRAGIVPSAMEFMERDAIEFTMKYVDIKFPISDDVRAHLIIEVDGNDKEVLMRECEAISEIMYAYDCIDVMFAESAQQKADLWRLRRATGEAVKSHSIYKEEDTVVPRAELAKLLNGVKKIGAKFGFNSVCYGHAGDGNLHVNIIKENMTDEEWNTNIPMGIKEIFHLCVSLGGTISGEHGIGYVQKGYMNIAFNETQINLQKGIKKLFDPNMILNPGKMFL